MSISAPSVERRTPPIRRRAPRSAWVAAVIALTVAGGAAPASAASPATTPAAASPATTPAVSASVTPGGVSPISTQVDNPVASSTPGFYTFSLTAPSATAVSVTGSWGLSYSYSTSNLTKRENGVWSVLLGPLTPGIYNYRFTVDGVDTKDPANVNVVTSQPTFSTFIVPGRSAEFLSPQREPKGSLSTLTYHSSVTGSDRKALVWTPPGYDRSRKAYPTLYLMHGGGRDYLDWVQEGGADRILDNLYNAGKIKPMVVVMPDGNIPGGTGAPQNDTFPTELADNVIPAVESTFKVSRSPEDRALAGLSLGGLQTFNTLLMKPGLVSQYGNFSSGYFPAVAQTLRTEGAALLSNPAINKSTTMLRIYVGNPMDIAYDNNILTRQIFDEFRIRYQFGGVYPEAEHVWKTWSNNLRDFAPRLFRR